MQTAIKHSMSCLPDSDIRADVDVERHLVTLRVRHFDSQHVADFVTRVLPEQGVVAFRDDATAHGPDGLTPPSPFQLALFLGGRRHVAQVVRLVSGKTTVWLEDPSVDRDRQLKAAAARALQLLHDAGWMAIAIDAVA